MKKISWKKVTGCLLAAGLAAGTIVGCGQQNASKETSGTTPGSDAPQEQVTLTFMRTGTPEVLHGIFDSIIADFEKEHPNIKIDMQDLGWSDAEKTLQVMASSKTLPDVMYHLPATIFDMADKGLIEDLTPYMDDELKNDVYPSLLEAGKYNGKQYLIPCGGTTLLYWYNTELFEQAGLDPDNPPATWADFLEAAKAIDEKTDAAGFAMYGKPSGGETSFVFESLFASEIGGPTWDGTSYAYEKPENKEAAINTLNFIKELTKYSQGSVEETGRFDIRTMLRDGHVGMALDAVNMANQIQDGLDSGKFKVAQLPAGSSGKAMSAVNIGGFFIPTNSEHKEEAWTFLRYLMNTENQKAHSTYGSIPILKSEADSYGTEDPYWNTIIKSVDESVPEGITPKTNALWLVTGEQLQLLMMDKQDAETTLNNIIEGHKEIYEE